MFEICFEARLVAKLKFFRFRPKTMDYSPWVFFWELKKSFEKVYHSIGNEKRNLMAFVSVA